MQYRFCRLVFGLTSSPAILNGTVQHHLSQYKQSEPQVAELLANSFYVDDFPGGASDDESAFYVYQKGKSIMHEGGFNLRKWSTSSSVLNQRICKEEGQDEHEPVVKILGLYWDTVNDAFHFDFAEVIEYIKSLPPTKRSVLKCSAKLFDPLGLISPFTVNLKMWFQKLCSDKADWDDRLEGELLKKWNLLANEFESMAKINVPGCYFIREKRPVSHQMHGFSDASEHAIAAAVYLCTVYEDGDVDVRLIASKTKVSPLKKQSIPRLELLGAYILSKLVDTIRTAFKSLPFEVDTYYWVDSFTALCWIKNHKPWKQYVQHRVDVIRKLTDKEKWRFCPGTMNPADIPSRGCSGKDLVENDLWWSGASFLKEPPELWPDTPTTFIAEMTSEELIKNPPVITHSLAAASVKRTPIENLEGIMDIERYSSKLKLLRVTGYILKFIWLLRQDNKVVKSRDLNVDDVNLAEVTWVRSVQARSFATERHILVHGAEGNQRIKQFNLYLDGDGVIRCKGRLNNAGIPQETKNPVLLPARHRYTELLIRERHEHVHHNGVRDTLNSI